MLRARNQAARRPAPCCAYATFSDSQATSVLRARNPQQPAGRHRVCCAYATNQQRAHNSIEFSVRQAGALIHIILFALKYILECMDLIDILIHIIQISYTA